MKLKALILTAVLPVAVGVFLGGCASSYEAQPVAVQDAPPPPRVEVVTVGPGPDYVWVEGYWVWHGGWVWQPGAWVARPHHHAVWVQGRWDHTRRGWYYQRGHWR